MKRLLFAIAMGLFIWGTHAQEPSLDSDITNFTPVSPTAASLGKFGETPVSLYTGIPSISVPLHEVQVGSFNLPIGLSYHAGGIRVEEVASWVGLGWSLNAGGAIVRARRGVYDEEMIERYNPSDVSKIENNTGTPQERGTIIANWFSGEYDTESDIFNFNFCGQSGKFFLDPEGNVYGLPANTFDIEFDPDLRISWGWPYEFFGRWTITDNQGVKYIFGVSQDGQREEYEVGVSLMNKGQDYSLQPKLKSINSWFLNEIILPSGEHIEFVYDHYSYGYEVQNSEYQSYSSKGPYSLGINRAYQHFEKALHLKEIRFPHGKLEFVAGGARKDLMDGKVLDRINVYHEDEAAPYKSFVFTTNNPASVTSESESFRLYLQSVQEFDALGNAKNPYSFEYLGGMVQYSRRDKGQDLWGFFNDEPNSSLIPTFIQYSPNYPDKPINILGGANRHVNPDKAQEGTIRKITYPTGGFTLFDFETHTARCPSPMGQTLLKHTIKGTSETKNLVCSSTNLGTAVSYGEPLEVKPTLNFCIQALASYSLLDLTPDFNENPHFVDVNLQKQDENGDFKHFQNLNYLRASTVPKRDYNNLYICLEKGVYRLAIQWKSQDDKYKNGYMVYSLTWEEHPIQIVDAETDIDVGGLRIKRIADYDINGTKEGVKEYKYEKADGNQQVTSGLVRNIPVYFYNKNDILTENGVCMAETMLHTHSVSQSPLLMSQGSTAYYTEVTVLHSDDGDNGKTVHKFYSPTDFPDMGIEESYYYPFPVPVTKEWCHGLPKQTTYYKRESTGFEPVLKEEYVYHDYFSIASGRFKSRVNLKTYIAQIVCSGNTSGVGKFYQPGIIRYNIGNGYPKLSSKRTVEYWANDSIEHLEEYRLNDKNFMLYETNKLISNDVDVIEYTTYAIDYYQASATSGDALAIKRLIEDYNMYHAPIEKYSYKLYPDGTRQMLQAELIRYYQDLPLAQEHYVLQIDEGMSFGAGGFLPTTLSGSNYLMHESYELLKTNSYDLANFNIIQQDYTNNISSCIIWGHDKRLPVATVTNAQRNQVHYEGFEDLLIGNSDLSKAGKKSRTNGYNKSLAQLSPGTYLLEYWKYVNQQWQHQIEEVQVAGSSYAISLSGHVDEVRFYPKEAQMTTYNYDLPFGLSEIIDASGLTQHYRFDAFGRLIAVTDDDGNVLQQTEYFYTTDIQ